MPGRKRGRPGSSEITRESIVLLSALCEEGATLSVGGVAARLGIDAGQARFLLDELMGLSLGEEGYLPVTEKGDSIVLISSQGMRGRPLRLTRAETYALVTALDQAGIPEGDQLRRALAALVDSTVSDEEVERALGGDASVSTGRALTACNRALVHRRRLAFSYRGNRDKEAREREVEVLGTREDEGLWYLDAVDVEVGRRKTFRVDRMGSLRETGPASPPSAGQAPRDAATPREVEVTFTDDSCLYVLEWPGAQVLSRSGGAVRVRIPYYGGDWLPRHLAACGAGADIHDDELRAATGRLAARLLEGA